MDEINLLMLKSKYEQALILSKKLIGEDSRNAQLYYLNGILNKQLYRYTESSNSIVKALKIEPNNIEFLNEYASVLVKRNRDIEALHVYKTIMELDIYNLNSGIYLSNYYLKNKKIEKAKGILLNLYSKDTINPYFTRNIGLCFIKMGKKAAALFWLNKTIELDCTDVKAYVLLARIYSATEEFDLALEYMDKAIELDPLNKEHYMQAGDIHVTRNHNFRAVPMYLKAYELDNGDSYIARNLGFCYYKIKKFEKAKQFLKIADADGLDLQVKIHLGNICQQQGTMDTSIVYYNQALEIIIPDFDSKYTLLKSKAESYYYLGNYEKAVENYLLAYNTNANSIWLKVRKNNILIDIAAIYAEKLKDKHKAIEYLEKVKNEKITFNGDDHYKYAQKQITKLKEELFFEDGK
jgi:tetratricopeptide (TPR) repeat protein